MPVPGVNVLENPTWTDVEPIFGSPRSWIVWETFDPMLCCGVSGASAIGGVDGGMEVLAPNLLRVDWGAATQLDPADDLYGGLIYSGGGFDGAPGAGWHIEFTATRRTFPASYVLPVNSLGNTLDLFVRFGITVKTGPGEWTSYYKNLPAAAFIGNGTVVNYAEDFEIPSDWPEGVYHFAVCTTGVPTLPAAGSLTAYRYGMAAEFSDFDLEFVSDGGGSAGPAGVLNPYVGWPLARWSPGYPNCCDPPVSCGGVIEWDQFVFRSPLTTSDSSVVANLPHTGILSHSVGRDDSYSFTHELAPLLADWAGGFPVGEPSNVCGPDSGFGPPDGTITGWVACGDFCFFLGMRYVVVPTREYLFSSVGPGTWIAAPPFVPLFLHPTSFPNHDLAAAYPDTPGGVVGAMNSPTDHTAVFCWASCQPAPPPESEPQPIYLTHEVAPGDLFVPAGGAGALNLRGIRGAP